MHGKSFKRHDRRQRGTGHRGIRRFRSPRRRSLVAVAVLVLLLASSLVPGPSRAWGQTPPAATVAPPAVTAESIESLRSQAAESTELDAETKQKIEALVVQALDGLKRITELAAQAEQFNKETEEVQQRVSQRRQRLAELQAAQPSLPTGLSLPELEQEVSRRDVQLAQLKSAQTKLESEPATRAARRREIRTLLLSAPQRLADVQKQLDTAPPANEPALLTAARRASLQVRKMLIDAEQPALQNELAKYDAEDAADFLRLERDVRAQEVKLAGTELDQLQSTLNKRRAADSQAAVRRARNALDAMPPALKPHAEENVELAETADRLGKPIKEVTDKLEATKALLEEKQREFTVTEQRVNDIGLTGSIGELLRRRGTDLPDLGALRRQVQDRKTLIEKSQAEAFEYDDRRSETIDDSLRRVLDAVTSDVDSTERDSLEAAARSLVEQRREFLDSVIRGYNTYLDTLFELDATQQRLIRVTQRYQDYIDERVLWIRSNPMLLSSFEVDESDTWLLRREKWNEVVRQLSSDFWSQPLIYAVGILLFALLLWQKPRFRRELDTTAQVAERGNCTLFAPTWKAAVVTLVMALTWPGLVLFLGWRLAASSDGSQFARAVAQALLTLSWVYFPLDLLRRVCRARGLAEANFHWAKSAIAVLRVNLKWVTWVGLVVVFVTSVLFNSDPEHGFDAVERAFFAAGTLVISVFLWRVLRPDTGIFREYLALHAGGWFDRLRKVWYWGCVLLPLVIGGMTITGYYYTAQQLTWRFYTTFVFFVAVQLVYAMLQRLLLVRRRAISIDQARQRRAAEAVSREQSGGGDASQLGPSKIVTIEEKLPDVAANTEQTQRLIRTGMIAFALIGMWLIWVDVLPALRLLDEWPVWTTTVSAGSQTAPAALASATGTGTGSDGAAPAPVATPDVLSTVTVADIGLAVLIGIVTFVCARNIPGLMEISVLQRLPLDNSIRYAITSVTSYAIVLLGIILAFNAISVGWSKIQWLATALTFGLAFGLQEIFANFVAGLILLFERPIRVGDVVTVDDVSGVVSRIRIRATTITNWDRKEYVLPNKEFITGRMLNWTLSDTTNRIVINVGVAYGSDVQRAKSLLLKVCEDHPVLLKEPPTVVTFEEFGDSSLSLVVRAFLPDLNNRLKTIDELHTNIDLAFREAGIEIAFPQRDLHVRSIDKSILHGLRPDSDVHRSMERAKN